VDLITSVGAARAHYLQGAPTWPALVAAVDEANQRHGWSPFDILSSALVGLPQDGSMSGHEVADALVLRIATITDLPSDVTHPSEGAGRDSQPEMQAPDIGHPDVLRPHDADEFQACWHRDHPDTETSVPGWDLPHEGPPHYVFRELPENASSWDPYASELPCEAAGHPKPEVTAEHAFPNPRRVTAQRIRELNTQAMSYFESC
jgi:hypothetical protein